MAAVLPPAAVAGAAPSIASRRPARARGCRLKLGCLVPRWDAPHAAHKRGLRMAQALLEKRGCSLVGAEPSAINTFRCMRPQLLGSPLRCAFRQLPCSLRQVPTSGAIGHMTLEARDPHMARGLRQYSNVPVAASHRRCSRIHSAPFSCGGPARWHGSRGRSRRLWIRRALSIATSAHGRAHGGSTTGRARPPLRAQPARTAMPLRKPVAGVYRVLPRRTWAATVVRLAAPDLEVLRSVSRRRLPLAH